MRNGLTKIASGTTAVLLGAMMTIAPAQADDYHCHGHTSQPAYSYQTVTKWVVKEVPYKVEVVRYKPCGTPYLTWENRFKSVKVPVTHRVKVYH